jgi:hypothetical protein
MRKITALMPTEETERPFIGAPSTASASWDSITLRTETVLGAPNQAFATSCRST